MCSRLGGSLMDQRDEDWRDTLFYWHGKVSWVGGERNVMTWRGTWLSSVSSHMPPASDFAASFNFFELNFDVDAERAQHLARGHTDLELFRGLRGEFRGHYLMEPPDGTGYRRAYRDDSHQFHIETHLEDPADPDSWSALRPPACICNYPPCANQTKCGVALCDEKGVDCSVEPTTSDAYWSYGPFFPTSELSLLREGDSLALYYRGFDGGYYKSLQSTPGDPAKFVYPPTRLGGFDGGENAIIE